MIALLRFGDCIGFNDFIGFGDCFGSNDFIELWVFLKIGFWDVVRFGDFRVQR